MHVGFSHFFFFVFVMYGDLINVYAFQQIPLSYISEAVYKTSADWINKFSPEEFGSFLSWSLDSIFADLVSQQAGAKGSKKGAPHVSSKSQVT